MQRAFERKVIGERIRDKFAASRRKGMWMGGHVPLGYRVENRKLLVNEQEAATVRMIFDGRIGGPEGALKGKIGSGGASPPVSPSGQVLLLTGISVLQMGFALVGRAGGKLYVL